MKTFAPALLLAAGPVPPGRLRAPPLLTGRNAVAQRILAVISTRPGTLPWRPTFGCALGDLVGQPAHPEVLHEAVWRVREALALWLPDVKVLACQATASPRNERPAAPVSGLGWSRAEHGLLALGGEAVLHIRLTVSTDDGPLELTLATEP